MAPVVALGPAGFATVTGMLASGLHYFPVTLPFLLVLLGLLALNEFSQPRPPSAVHEMVQASKTNSATTWHSAITVTARAAASLEPLKQLHTL